MKLSKHLACSIVAITSTLSSICYSALIGLCKSFVSLVECLAFTLLMAGYFSSVAWLTSLFHTGLLKYYFPAIGGLSLTALIAISAAIGILGQYLATRVVIPGFTKLTQSIVFSLAVVVLSAISALLCLLLTDFTSDIIEIANQAALAIFVGIPMIFAIHRLIKWAWETAPECAAGA